MAACKQKTLPSGKVYKQIFDAEVQLIQALKNPCKKPEVNHDDEPETTLREVHHIPAIKDPRGGAGLGLLNERQLSWIDGFPNESYIQNPVLYKFYSDHVKQVNHPTSATTASEEVQTLPDVVVPGKPKSDIIERIADSRKERHEGAVEDMRHELAAINTKLEPRIQDAGELLISKMDANNTEINGIMAKIDHDEEMFGFTEPELLSLWTDVCAHSVQRHAWVKEMEDTLQTIEQERIAMIRDIFSSYYQQLEKIAHLMLPDLHRFMDGEAQEINHMLLSNRRGYGELTARLLMNDMDREKHLHSAWSARLAQWKALQADHARQDYEAFMESGEVMLPEGVGRVREEWRKAQDTLNGNRMELITSLNNMKPPASRKTLAYEWNQQIKDISKEIDQMNQAFFSKFYAEYENVCQKCLERADNLKTDLIERGIATETEAQMFVEDWCLPLVGKLQAGFEKYLEEMDHQLEFHNNLTMVELKSLFKLIQGAAHMWDIHELGLAKQERYLQEKLDQARSEHDNENHDLEANLDIVMDRMRQDATEEKLVESLTRAHQMMAMIKHGYYMFHETQKEIVCSYTDMVDGELQQYDMSLCSYFAVNWNDPATVSSPTASERAPPSRAASALVISDKPPPGNSPPPVDPHVSQSDSKVITGDSETEVAQLVVSEVLSTTRGTTFYVLKLAGEHGVKEDGEMDAEQEEEEELQDYLQGVHISKKTIKDVKRKIMLNFLDHVEDWKEQAANRAECVITAKLEELNNELDLRLHLHDPRPRRAELDVHNVRAAELVMHKERVVRHCKGISQALSDLKHNFTQMTSKHDDLYEQFTATILGLETAFINATKSSKLVALSAQLQTEQDQYMDAIRASLRQFRQHLDDVLQMLRQSNTRFIKSFKLFCDGGNFCPEEVADYQKRLERMSHKMNTTEGFIMQDMEGMESKRQEQAARAIREFQDKFKHHLVDLLFIEKIVRWLTNTQVKVKSQVADSNSEARTLTQMLSDLERRVDACERPNLDKEEVMPVQLNASLLPISTMIYKRAEYMNAMKPDTPRTVSATLQGNPAHGARVGFQSEVSNVSRPGKLATEDVSLGVIRNILKTQKERLSVAAEPTVDESFALITQQAKHDAVSDEASDKKSRHSDSRVSSVKMAASTDHSKRVSSGIVVRHSKGPKIDKRFFVFGEHPVPDEDTHFLGKLKHMLRDALDGLLVTGEAYYRQKGTRPVTRPDMMQETFDLCGETLVQKVQHYYIQADNFHNESIHELRSQLMQYESLVAQVPGCVFGEIVNQWISQSNELMSQLSHACGPQIADMDRVRAQHQTELRPSLGHPDQKSLLLELCERETQRHEACLSAIHQYHAQQQARAVEEAGKFTELLAGTSEKLLLQYDGTLTVDDVIRGRVVETKHPTTELLRRYKAGASLHDDQDKDRLPRGQRTWPGLSKTEMVLPVTQVKAEQTPESKRTTPVLRRAGSKGSSPASRRSSAKTPKEEVSTTTAAVTTAKTTLGHTATVRERDIAYQKYKKNFERIMRDIDEEKNRQITSETRWYHNWKVDVEKVKSFY